MGSNFECNLRAWDRHAGKDRRDGIARPKALTAPPKISGDFLGWLRGVGWRLVTWNAASRTWWRAGFRVDPTHWLPMPDPPEAP